MDNLISAAPDLLIALKDLVRYLEYIEPDSVCELEFAKKAIAKAESNNQPDHPSEFI